MHQHDETNTQFLHILICADSITQSVCRKCSATIGFSSQLTMLSIAERAHKCGQLSQSLKSRIFVVDDDARIAEIESQILRRAGFEVDTFNCATAAAQCSLNVCPDAVVSSYAMPEIDGLTLAAWFKENHPTSKIVLLTGESELVAERTIAGLRFTLLHKPVDPAVLIASVADQIRRS